MSKKAAKRITRRSGFEIRVAIAELTGDFAEDKDVAANIREEQIRTAVAAKNEVVLDFAGVTLVTQSFVHALVSDVLRVAGADALRYIVFQHCNEGVRGIVETVVQYSLETMDDDGEASQEKMARPARKRKRKT